MTLRGGSSSNKTTTSAGRDGNGNGNAAPSLASAFSKSDGQRHGSSGADSWHSTDTVRRPTAGSMGGGANGGGAGVGGGSASGSGSGNVGGARGTPPMKVNTNKHLAQYVIPLCLHPCLVRCNARGVAGRHTTGMEDGM